MKYDAIVIGSGLAGNPLSYQFAELGRQVALIDKENVGGTCVNTGCAPMKTMAHRAQIVHYGRNAARWGLRAANDVVLGTAILGSEGGKLVHVLYTLMLGNLPYTVLKGAIYIHPRLCEGFFTLLDSVKLVD